MASVARVVVDVLSPEPTLDYSDFTADTAVACLDDTLPADPVAAIRADLQRRLGSERFDLWFARKTQMTLAESELRIAAGNDFAGNWIRTKFLGDVQAAAREVLGREVHVEITIAAETSWNAGSDDKKTLVRPAATNFAPPASQARTYPSATPAVLLNPKFTLEEFVVGPSNQLAHHAAMEVSEKPGQQYNPLFIHGHCGLGKTHLLQGICQRFAKLHPGHKWLYLTAETFTNDFLEAIRTHKTDAFRKRIRSAELLVIDDVHFLANKKATQEEFLHTFNQIDAGGRQIVLASDCAPKQITTLAESLSSRFVSGMVLRVDSPDLATRLEILRRKALRNHWNVADAVLMHIALSAASSVREMEGLLLRAVAGISLLQSPSAGDSTGFLTDLRRQTAVGRGPLQVERIVAAVAQHFGLATTAILSTSRERAVSTARAVTMYLARQHCGMSFPELGRALGNKNHSTVIAACQRMEALRTSGALLSWQIQGETRHQTVADVLHDLESAIRHSR